MSLDDILKVKRKRHMQQQNKTHVVKALLLQCLTQFEMTCSHQRATAMVRVAGTQVAE